MDLEVLLNFLFRLLGLICQNASFLTIGLSEKLDKVIVTEMDTALQGQINRYLVLVIIKRQTRTQILNRWSFLGLFILGIDRTPTSHICIPSTVGTL